MESIINDRINCHISRNNLLLEKLYGFARGKSCATQLLHCRNKWSYSLDQRKPVDVVFIDFSKAFDSVVHCKLIFKLALFGIRNHTLNWIKAFLNNRSQVVKINGILSESLPVKSGVPQGSVLGPTLFNIFINDLVSNIQHSDVVLFAEDVKLFSKVPTELQIDLDNLYEWTHKWQMSISLEKCAVLHLGFQNVKTAYKLANHELKVSRHMKDLGVITTSDLQSTSHCTEIYRKCSRICAPIHKSFLSRNTDLMLKAFKVYA